MSLSETQEHIFQTIDKKGSSSRWRDWKWQMKHCVRDLNTFEKVLNIRLSDELRRQFSSTVKRFSMSITPYYLSLIDTDNLENDPIFKQSFPSVKELILSPHDMADSLDEDKDSPVPGITHRYPDRVLFLVSN